MLWVIVRVPTRQRISIRRSEWKPGSVGSAWSAARGYARIVAPV